MSLAAIVSTVVSFAVSYSRFVQGSSSQGLKKGFSKGSRSTLSRGVSLTRLVASLLQLLRHSLWLVSFRAVICLGWLSSSLSAFSYEMAVSLWDVVL